MKAKHFDRGSLERAYFLGFGFDDEKCRALIVIAPPPTSKKEKTTTAAVNFLPSGPVISLPPVFLTDNETKVLHRLAGGVGGYSGSVYCYTAVAIQDELLPAARRLQMGGMIAMKSTSPGAVASITQLGVSMLEFCREQVAGDPKSLLAQLDEAENERLLFVTKAVRVAPRVVGRHNGRAVTEWRPAGKRTRTLTPSQIEVLQAAMEGKLVRVKNGLTRYLKNTFTGRQVTATVESILFPYLEDGAEVNPGYFAVGLSDLGKQVLGVSHA